MGQSSSVQGESRLRIEQDHPVVIAFEANHFAPPFGPQIRIGGIGHLDPHLALADGYWETGDGDTRTVFRKTLGLKRLIEQGLAIHLHSQPHR